MIKADKDKKEAYKLVGASSYRIEAEIHTIKEVFFGYKYKKKRYYSRYDICKEIEYKEINKIYEELKHKFSQQEIKNMLFIVKEKKRDSCKYWDCKICKEKNYLRQ